MGGCVECQIEGCIECGVDAEMLWVIGCVGVYMNGHGERGVGERWMDGVESRGIN